jgi:hypothetical protein
LKEDGRLAGDGSANSEDGTLDACLAANSGRSRPMAVAGSAIVSAESIKTRQDTEASAADWVECAKRGAALGGSPRQTKRYSNRPKLPVPEGIKMASRDLFTDKL